MANVILPGANDKTTAVYLTSCYPQQTSVMLLMLYDMRPDYLLDFHCDNTPPTSDSYLAPKSHRIGYNTG
jgi:hypothetical protein